MRFLSKSEFYEPDEYDEQSMIDEEIENALKYPIYYTDDCPYMSYEELCKCDEKQDDSNEIHNPRKSSAKK